MPGLTIAEGTKERFDAFKYREKCSTATAIDMLLLYYGLFEALQRENTLLRRENERLQNMEK